MSSPRRRLSSGAGAVLIVLLTITLPMGCGGRSPAGSTSGPKSVAARLAGSTGGSKAVVGASAGARGTASAAPPAPALRTPTRAAAPASLHRVSPSPGGRPLRRFAGYGDRSLGTIVVRSASVLVWNARHPAIQIFTAEGFMLVNSKLPNGAVQLSAGTYRGVRVASGAHWSIELRSRP